MPRAKPLPLPLETPSLVKQFRAIAGDPYSWFVCAWPPRKFVSCSSDAQSEIPDAEIEERLAGAERAARDEIRERVEQFTKPKKKRRSPAEMAEARAQRRIEDRGRQRAATSGTFLEGAAAEQEAWLRSIQDEALPT